MTSMAAARTIGAAGYQRPMRVLHLITALDTGGAQMMLYKLLSASDPNRVSARVISLVTGGDLAEPIRDLGWPVADLGLRRGRPNPTALAGFIRRVRAWSPDLVQTWMYHADLVGALARPWLGAVPLLWNLRQSDLDPVTSKRTTRWTVRLCAALSRAAPSHILCCSEQTRRVHRALGYRADIMSVIPNGFDLDLFRPDPSARVRLRDELGLTPGTPLICGAARFDPQKDFRTLLVAMARLREQAPLLHLVLCGSQLEATNPLLAAWLAELRLADRTHLLGLRRDMPRILAGCDLLVSASAYGEGFPNIVGEAMACGIPCVVTDVGDSAAIVADTGAVVAPRDPAALAAAIGRLLACGRPCLVELGARARQRVAEQFALPAIADQYTRLYESLANGVLR
ncbi:glycosyltransferase [Thioalkalicoccus limnaeus]|uniref:Glycosyltransferase n=1 Tax=Thioalkalicoccus limnaeus TaxID=120681 RepID=A0ABV4BDU8_9GAMM